MRPTYAEIDLGAIRYNMAQICAISVPKVNIMAVVKADAYGHGAIPVSRAVLASGADSLAVAIPEEGRELREAGFTVPILVLGLAFPDQADLFVKYQLTATVCTLDTVTAFSQAASRQRSYAKIMLKVDTGMGRIGIEPSQIADLAQQTIGLPNVRLVGLFTHLASADSGNKTYAHQQLALFDGAVQNLQNANINLPILSAANSATIMDLPAAHFTALRPGIILYGLPPSDEIQNPLKLRPAMALKTKIAYIKRVPANTCIGYGCTYVTKESTFIATLPLGYADGYSRHLSNQAPVLIGGKRHPLIGRVCMDQIMIDLGPVCDAKVDDEAVLFGRQGDEEITVTELAQLAGTINYELVCAISKRVPRIYTNEKEAVL